ncbi:MAG: hypothetical protein QGH42_10605 [Kiritimatiellia bacterium]|nr:hypothetical protein [Kiritimatiellia bacterium]
MIFRSFRPNTATVGVPRACGLADNLVDVEIGRSPLYGTCLALDEEAPAI